MGDNQNRRVALIQVQTEHASLALRTMCGRPLLYWMCKAAADCGAVDAVYVAAADPEVDAVARALNIEKVEVISLANCEGDEQLQALAERVDFRHALVLNTAYPFLVTAYLDAAWRRIDEGFDNIVAVTNQRCAYWDVSEEGDATPADDPSSGERHIECQGLHIMCRKKKAESIRTGAVILDPAHAIGVETPDGWRMREALLEAQLRAAKDPVEARLRKVKLVASDVDGCLTDSGMYYGEQGDELKKFNTRDGMGFKRLQAAGYLCAIITAEDTRLMERRAKKLGIEELHQGAADKVPVMEALLGRHGLTWDEVAYLGDDVGDLGVLTKAGVSACPSDAIPEARRIVDMCLSARGGGGALRELAEHILSARHSAQG